MTHTATSISSRSELEQHVVADQSAQLAADIIARSAHSLICCTSVAQVCEAISGILSGLLGITGACLWVADPELGSMELVLATGSLADTRRAAPSDLWRGTPGQVIREGCPVYEQEPVVRRRKSLALHGEPRWGQALLPLLDRGTPVGLLSLSFAEPGSLENAQRETLEELADLVAAALVNATRLTEYASRANRLQAIAELTQRLAGRAWPSEAAATVHEAVSSVVDVSGFSMLLPEPGERSLKVSYLAGADGPRECESSPPVSVCGGATGQAFRSTHPCIHAPVAGGTGTSPLAPGEPAPRCVLSVPLVHDERAIGVMEVRSAKADAYGWREMHLLTLVASQATSSLINSGFARARSRSRNESILANEVALEMLDQAVFVCAPDGHIRYANPAAARTYGRRLDTLVGLHISAIAADEGDTADAESWSTGEHVHCRGDGSEFPVALSVTELHNDDGVLLGTVASARDLTDERRVEEQLRQSEKMVALGELVAGVAHEVNNPLTGISAFAQILAADQLNEEQLEAVSLIKREADRAVGVIRDLLAFARKSGPQVVEVKIGELIEQTLRLRAYGLRSAGVEPNVRFDPGLRRVYGDSRQLQQVLLNLIINAEQAMSSSARRELIISARNAGERVVVEMRDTGNGIPPEARRRIFEPFFTTKPEGTGTGLGLSVSYGIVRAHGGTLALASSNASGTTFRITLPALVESETSTDGEE